MEYISTYALFHLENLPSMKIKKNKFHAFIVYQVLKFN